MMKFRRLFNYLCSVKSEISQMKTILIAITVLLVSVVLLGVKVLFVKGGRFPSGHVHDNPELRRRGISCAGSSDGDTMKK